MITLKPGVQFTRIAPAGMRLLDALKATSRTLGLDFVITCACEDHAATNPHTLGEAYDVRTHDFTAAQKRVILRQMLTALQDDPEDAIEETSGGLATAHFFGQLEYEGAPKEHLHFQRRKGTVYTIEEYLAV